MYWYQLVNYNSNNKKSNCVNDSNKGSKDCYCRGGEEDEHPTPIKSSMWQAKHTASDSLA